MDHFLLNIKFPQKIQKDLNTVEQLKIKPWSFESEQPLNKFLMTYADSLTKQLPKQDQTRSGSSQGNLLLKVLVKIDFNQLRHLNIINMNLISVEPINSLFAPHLSKINLSQNKIVCYKPFAKCNFVLDNLEIGSTVAQFDQGEYLNRTKIPNKTYLFEIQQDCSPVCHILIKVCLKTQPSNPNDPNIASYVINRQSYPKYRGNMVEGIMETINKLNLIL